MNTFTNNHSVLLSQGTKDHFYLDMTDDVVRGSIVLNKGAKTWPPNPPISVAAAVSPKAAAAAKGNFNLNFCESYFLPFNFFCQTKKKLANLIYNI